MPDKICELEGVEFNKDEIASLIEMFKSKGYQQYLRVFEAIRKSDVESTLGNPSAYKLEAFLHAQGAYSLIDALKHLPESAEMVSQELEGKSQEEEK